MRIQQINVPDIKTPEATLELTLTCASCRIGTRIDGSDFMIVSENQYCAECDSHGRVAFLVTCPNCKSENMISIREW